MDRVYMVMYMVDMVIDMVYKLMDMVVDMVYMTAVPLLLTANKTSAAKKLSVELDKYFI